MSEGSFFYRFATSRVAVGVAIVVFLLMIAAVVFRLIDWWFFAAILILSVLGFVIYGLVRDLVAMRRDQGFEKGMDAHAESQERRAQAGERAAIAEMHERWKQGMEKLRSSRAGKGRKAVYFLPWYLIIGKPGTGKTCAIKGSGLHFPLGVPKTAGTGGTRNCDWFFAEEAILLDTAGRFTSSEDHSADRNEWLEFLGLVRKYRRDMPINGLLVAVAADELLATGDVVDDARTLRVRLDELIAELKIQFPVYLLITKCDLVPGFSDFFGALPRARREELLGWTNPTWEMDDYAAELRGGLGQFLDRVTELRPALMQDEEDAEIVRNIFVFPEHLAELNTAIARYCDVLFRETRYNESPFLRGVYFTSAMQTGSTIKDIAKGLGVDERPLEDSKSYFLQDFFQERLKEDDRLVVPTGSAKTRWRIANNLGLGAIAAISVIVATLATASYLRNRPLLNRIEDDIAYASALPQLTRSEQAERLKDYWKRLETLRSRASNPDRLERFGLFQGRAMLPVLESAFLRTYESSALLPSLNSAETAMMNFASERTSDVKRGIKGAGALVDFVRDVAIASGATSELKSGGESLATWWDPSIDPEGRSGFAASYRAYLRDPFKVGDEARQNELRKEQRRRLESINTALPRIFQLETMEAWLADDDGEVRYPPRLVDEQARNQRVRAAYTQERWQNVVKPLVDKVTLLPDGVDRAVVDAFIPRYEQAYYEEWWKFFESFSVNGALSWREYCDAMNPVRGLDGFSMYVSSDLGPGVPPGWLGVAASVGGKGKEYEQIIRSVCARLEALADPCDHVSESPFEGQRGKVRDLCMAAGDPADPRQLRVMNRCVVALSAPIEKSQAKIREDCVAPALATCRGGIEQCSQRAMDFCRVQWSRFLDCASGNPLPGAPGAVPARDRRELLKAIRFFRLRDEGRNATFTFDPRPSDTSRGYVITTTLSVLCAPTPFELAYRNDTVRKSLIWSAEQCSDARLSVKLDDGSEVVLAEEKGDLALPRLLGRGRRSGSELRWEMDGVSVTMGVESSKLQSVIELSRMMR